MEKSAEQEDDFNAGNSTWAEVLIWPWSDDYWTNQRRNTEWDSIWLWVPISVVDELALVIDFYKYIPEWSENTDKFWRTDGNKLEDPGRTVHIRFLILPWSNEFFMFFEGWLKRV